MKKEKTAREYADLLAKTFQSQNMMSPQSAFREWLELYSEAIIAQTSGDCGRYEELLLDICSRPMFSKISEVYSTAGELFAEAMELKEDVLGLVYAKLGANSNRSGQFYYTPYHVSEMMARISLDEGECKQLIAEGKSISISEPCVGSGGMLIAVHKVTSEFGIDPESVELTGTDIDETCVRMALLQLSALGACASLNVGNSLTGEVWHQWETPLAMLKRDGYALVFANYQKLQNIFQKVSLRVLEL